jgi:hypothetical protein
MTDAAPTPKQERKARNGGLFVKDSELLRRLGVPEKLGYEALAMLDENPNSIEFYIKVARATREPARVDLDDLKRWAKCMVVKGG